MSQNLPSLHQFKTLYPENQNVHAFGAHIHLAYSYQAVTLSSKIFCHLSSKMEKFRIPLFQASNIRLLGPDINSAHCFQHHKLWKQFPSFCVNPVLQIKRQTLVAVIHFVCFLCIVAGVTCILVPKGMSKSVLEKGLENYSEKHHLKPKT